jgi:hypothetical protein
MIEIGPKAPTANFFGQITVNCGDDPHIHLMFLIGTHPL